MMASPGRVHYTEAAVIHSPRLYLNLYLHTMPVHFSHWILIFLRTNAEEKGLRQRHITTHIDDEARGDSNIADLFESTDDEEDVVSVIDNDLVDSDDDTAGCCEEAIVDVFSQVSAQQRKFLKLFYLPGFAQYPGSSWSLTVSKIGADIALPTLDAVFNFIVTFCNRGGPSTEVGKGAN